jgi:hypothetical protein
MGVTASWRVAAYTTLITTISGKLYHMRLNHMASRGVS